MNAVEIRRQYLTIADVASRLGCSERHVRNLLARRELVQPVRLGLLVRWDADEFESWLRDRATGDRANRGGKRVELWG